MSWKIESFSSEMLKRQNAKSSNYQVHSARAHVTVSFVHNGGRNMLRNAFSALTGHYVSVKDEHFFFLNNNQDNIA